jgi:hypothetical protein
VGRISDFLFKLDDKKVLAEVKKSWKPVSRLKKSWMHASRGYSGFFAGKDVCIRSDDRGNDF